MISKSIYYLDKLAAKLRARDKVTVPQRREFIPAQYLDEISLEKHKDGISSFVLSIDDTSMKQAGMLTSDNGGDVRGSVRAFLCQIAKEDLLPTLYFVPSPRYVYLSDVKRVLPNDRYDISKLIGHEFVEWLLKQQNDQKLEIAVHGLHHINESLIGYHSFEFDGIPKEEMKRRLINGHSKMSEIFDVHGFKPPAWSIGNLRSTEKQFIDVLNRVKKYNYVSLSLPQMG